MMLWRAYKGQRVMTAPHTDQWMQGDRYGTISLVGRKWIHVQMDSGRKERFVIEKAGGFSPTVSSLMRIKREGEVSGDE